MVDKSIWKYVVKSVILLQLAPTGIVSNMGHDVSAPSFQQISCCNILLCVW